MKFKVERRAAGGTGTAEALVIEADSAETNTGNGRVDFRNADGKLIASVGVVSAFYPDSGTAAW
jgi:hypothetical protein